MNMYSYYKQLHGQNGSLEEFVVQGDQSTYDIEESCFPGQSPESGLPKWKRPAIIKETTINIGVAYNKILGGVYQQVNTRLASSSINRSDEPEYVRTAYSQPDSPVADSINMEESNLSEDEGVQGFDDTTVEVDFVFFQNDQENYHEYFLKRLHGYCKFA
ncbi:hypothetical protein PIB30_060443 [Stylosanthes scabra]|uniref:Uncharacterized protein n=1 Tax=Stylosanthes scabra TaxID=79078 RepID=A0ABU6WKF0_9FABA|nr:hypothetical protein [Stylosanthes scabra]